MYTLELEYMSDDIRVIRRAIMSEEARARYNAVEALENLIGANLAQRLIPLIDDIPAEEKGRKGKKFFPIDPQPADDVRSMVSYVQSWGDDVLREAVVTYALRAYPEIDWSSPSSESPADIRASDGKSRREESFHRGPRWIVRHGEGSSPAKHSNIFRYEN